MRNTIGMALAMLAISTSGLADDAKTVAAAKKAIQANQKALINVSAVVKTELKGGGAMASMVGGMVNKEQKVEAAATIIDPSGLAVTAYSAVKSAGPMPKIHVRGGGGGAEELTFDTSMQDVKIRAADGTEIDARVVLKDEDLDLAFIAPKANLTDTQRQKIAAINLANLGKAQLLDTVIIAGRGSKKLNYVMTADVNRVNAEIDKPRQYFMIPNVSPGDLVLDETGKPFGVGARVRGGDDDENENSMSMVLSLLGSSAVLPLSEVAKLVDQAKDEMKKPVVEKE